MAGRPGRSGAPPGERHGNAVLTDAIVREIRARRAAGGTTILGMANDYDVGYSTVWCVVAGKTWRHLLEGVASAEV